MDRGLIEFNENNIDLFLFVIQKYNNKQLKSWSWFNDTV